MERVEAARALSRSVVHDSMGKAPLLPLKEHQLGGECESIVVRTLSEVMPRGWDLAVVKVDMNTGLLSYFKSLNGTDGHVFLSEKEKEKDPQKYQYTSRKGLRGVR